MWPAQEWGNETGVGKRVCEQTACVRRWGSLPSYSGRLKDTLVSGPAWAAGAEGLCHQFPFVTGGGLLLKAWTPQHAWPAREESWAHSCGQRKPSARELQVWPGPCGLRGCGQVVSMRNKHLSPDFLLYGENKLWSAFSSCQTDWTLLVAKSISNWYTTSKGKLASRLSNNLEQETSDNQSSRKIIQISQKVSWAQGSWFPAAS